MKIYHVANSEAYVSLTDPASCRQVIAALKLEGLIKRNCRYASYSLEYMGPLDDTPGIAVMKGDDMIFALWPTQD
jgi:hypothetical protein